MLNRMLISYLILYLHTLKHIRHKYYGAPGPGGRGTASSALGAPPIQGQFSFFYVAVENLAQGFWVLGVHT